MESQQDTTVHPAIGCLNTISAQILPIEPQDQHQPIHRVPVNGSSMTVRFFEQSWSTILQLKVGCPNFGHLPYKALDSGQRKTELQIISFRVSLLVPTIALNVNGHC